jgi:hypothetical protein
MSQPIVNHPILARFFENYLLPLKRSKIEPLLKESDLLEERVGILQNTFSGRGDWINAFTTLIKSMHAFENTPALEEQIRFFTAKHTRNWLIVNLMHDVLRLKETQLDLATGRLPSRAHDIVQNAYLAMNALGEESRYKNYLFATGLMFDFVLLASKSPHFNPSGAKFDELVKTSYAKGIEQAKKAVLLSKHKERLSLEKFVPILPLLRQASMCIFAFIEPKWLDLNKKCEAAKVSETVRCALEQDHFGLHTGTIMTFIAQSFSVFENLAESASNWPYVYISWQDGRKDHHDAAAMAALTVALGERLPPAAFPDGQRASAGMPELEYLDYVTQASVLGGKAS